jgi:rhombotail lipoprotein
MKRPLARLLATLPLLALLVGCGAEAPPRPAMAPAAAAAAPAPLARSFYSKDPSGSLSESDMQHVLETPVDLQFPARLGVVPLAAPFDARAHATLQVRAVASRDFASALAGDRHFSHVSDISTDLPNEGGIEGLRVIAARYRMRYLLLYSERFEDQTHLNGLAWLYPTFLGMFVVPGVTVESQGLVQADLLDVRSGTVLFSVVEPIHVTSKELMVGAARAHRELQNKAAGEAAKRLASRVTAQTNQIVAYADEMAAPGARDRHPPRLLPAPVLAERMP